MDLVSEINVYIYLYIEIVVNTICKIRSQGNDYDYD